MVKNMAPTITFPSLAMKNQFHRLHCNAVHRMHLGQFAKMGPLTLRFDRASQRFLKFDRRHWGCTLQSTGTFEK